MCLGGKLAENVSSQAGTDLVNTEGMNYMKKSFGEWTLHCFEIYPRTLNEVNVVVLG